MEHAIEIRGLCKRYSAFTLNNVSFSLPGGAILGLIGENGAGKSTTIKCMLGLVTPDAGEVSLLGRAAGDRALREDVGVVLDESSFHDILRAREMGKILSKIYKTWDSALFAQYLQKFSLPGDKPIKEFSRGMKMKLSIAAALAHRPKLLILDEATGGLDPVVRSEILDEFLSFIRDEDHAILLSSHITSDLEKIADYVAYLHDGQLVLSGEKDVLLETHGRLICGKGELEGIDKALLGGVRTGQFGCEALVKNRREFARRYPGLTVDPVTLDEIMVLTGKGVAV